MKTPRRRIAFLLSTLAIGGLVLLALGCGPAEPAGQETPAMPTAEPTPQPTKDPRPITVPTGGVDKPEFPPTAEELGLPEGLEPPEGIDLATWLELLTPEPKPTRRAIDIEYCRNLHSLIHEREYWQYTQECRGLIYKTAHANCNVPAGTPEKMRELSVEQQTCIKAELELVRDYAHRSKLGYPCLAVGIETKEEFLSCLVTAGVSDLRLSSQVKDLLTMIYAAVDQKDAVVKAKAPLFECLTPQQKELAADDVATLQPLFWIDLLRDKELRAEFHGWDADRQGKIRQRAAAVDTCAEKSGYYEVFHAELLAEIRRLQELDPVSVEPITLLGWDEYFKERGYGGFKPRPDKF